MADFDRCITALNRAAGRELSPEEIQQVFDKIKTTAAGLKSGKIKPTGAADLSTPDGLIQHAAELQAKEMAANAARDLAKAQRQVETLATRRAEIDAMKAKGISEVDSVYRLIANTADGKANAFSLEARVKGVSQLMKAQIQDTWAALDRSFMDYLFRRDRMKLLLEEIRGKDTGDAMAKKGAQAWKDSAEGWRKTFNERGGNIGHLEDWGLPQHHSQELVARAGRDAWVAYVFDRLNLSKYTDLAGNQMSHAEVRKLLENAWTTIASNGANKIEVGKHKGSGAVANRHAEERQIHFRDADAMIEYWGQYGERTLPDILMGHVETMARDIAMVEHFGPNPNAAFQALRDAAQKSATLADPTKLPKVTRELSRLDKVWAYASGKQAPTVNRAVSGFFDAAHNLNTAAKLGSAFWASLIGDKVMFEALGHLNKLPAWQRWWNELRLLNPLNAAERRQLRRQAIMLDYMSQAMHRFGDDLGKSSLTGKLANGVMKVTGMSAVNEWRRGAWALTAMDTLGHIVSRKDFAHISADDMRLLTSYGINEADWKVWKLAELDNLGHGNNEALTPEAVSRIPDEQLRAAGFDSPAETRHDAVVKLMGALTSESHLAVIEPGWKQRAAMYSGLERGSIKGELTRSFWQFKAFPLTQFENFLALAWSRPTPAGKAAFLTVIPLMQTMAGAMIIQVQEMLSGRDPRPMDDWRFWLAAFLKGGSLGLYGDFLFSGGQTRYGMGPIEAVAGPTIGTMAEVLNLAYKASEDAQKGQIDKTAGRVVQLAKSWVPGQNMWMTKAATDHLIFQNLQEALNPGYLSSVRASTQRNYGNDFWWEPGETLPSRAPNLQNALESR